MSQENERVFEQEVRRVARQLFPGGGGFSAAKLRERERDGIFFDGETIHIVEATCSRRKDKAQHDLEKSRILKSELQKEYQEYNFKIWLITSEDPTVDQAAVGEAMRKRARCPVSAMSFSAFSTRLANAPEYMAARQNYPFGSIRSPHPDKPLGDVDEGQFIPLDLIDSDSKASISVSEIPNLFEKNPGMFVLVGDFGAGKSMTMRHVFYLLRDGYNLGSSTKFPIFLNLRDHIGQDDPDSALFDHGRKIGFDQPERLVRAWRAGFVHMLLDGFDEVASSRFRSDIGGLRAVRRRAMLLVRKFVEQHPKHQTAIFISGRENYFGTASELEDALGLSGSKFRKFTLNEFTEEQVEQYLSRLGLNVDAIPDWLPSRPLLLGYLAVRGVLANDRSFLRTMSRAEGWDYLLDRICEREGRQIEDLGGQADRVRAYVDRLATQARATVSGRGPLSVGEMVDLFRQVFPGTPDDAAQQLLLRMAGLTASAATSGAVVSVTPDQEDAREFVDGDLVDAARAGDVARYIAYSYDEGLCNLFSDRNCHVCMRDLGVEVAARKIPNVTGGQVTAALRRAAEDLNAPALSFDIIQLLQVKTMNIVAPPPHTIFVRDGYFSVFELTGGVDLSGVVLKDCIIDSLYIDQSSGEITGPKLQTCLVEQVFGAVSQTDLPAGVVDGSTDISAFGADLDTASDIRQQPLPEAVRVLLVTLRKLFVQSGSGRRATAFPRGLSEAERAYVPEILALLTRHNFAHPHKLGGPAVWIPNRSLKREAMDIMRAPQQSHHPLIEDARAL